MEFIRRMTEKGFASLTEAVWSRKMFLCSTGGRFTASHWIHPPLAPQANRVAGGLLREISDRSNQKATLLLA